MHQSANLRVIQSVLLFSFVTYLGGCCVKKLDLKPVAQVAATGSVSFALEQEYEFAQCLTRIEKEIVQEAKAELLASLKDVRAGRITQADFEQFAANTATALDLLQRTVAEDAAGGAGFREGSRQAAAANLLEVIAGRPR